MKNVATNQIKNISILGNAGSGKTTLAEAMLFEGGVIDRRGAVEQKNTVSDYNDIEHENGNSVFSSLLFTEVNDKKINFIDNPGLDDFVGGMVSSLTVVHTGLMVLNAHNGIEVGTEIQGRYLEKQKKPMILVMNQLDHEKSDFEGTLDAAKAIFGNNITLVQYPVNEGTGFDTFVDVLLMKQFKFPKDGGKPEISDIPASENDKANELHAILVEKAAENDENLMELFFEKGNLEVDDIRKGLNAGIRQRAIFPVMCISAKKNMGVGRLMEFLANVAPSPLQFAAPKDVEGNEIKCDADGPTALYIFKSSIEPHVGEVSFFRVMSGKVTEGMDLVNTNNGTRERLGQLFVCAGKNRIKVTELVAGDLGATVKLKNTKTCHTLCGLNAQIQFKEIVFPEPRYRTAIRAINEADEEKLGDALSKMHLIDPTYVIEHSKELKQTLLHGQGEYHLNILKWHLDNVYKVATEYLAPKIPYRETITKSAQSEYRHKKQSGGAGQFGEVHLIIEPYQEGVPEPTLFKINGKEIKLNIRDKEEVSLPWGGKLIYYNCIVGGSIDTRFLPAILKGIMEKMEEGPLTGSYARDIRVFVYDGKMHPVDSNEISFKLAGRNAFKEAFKLAGPKIMEPVYLVEVIVPSDRLGDVMSDLQGRRALVLGMESEKGFEKITAKVPLAEMNKYSTSLSSITAGRASYTMKFSEYQQVPAEVQATLLKTYESTLVEE